MIRPQIQEVDFKSFYTAWFEPMFEAFCPQVFVEEIYVYKQPTTTNMNH